MLALVMVGSAMLIAMVLGKVFGWDIGLTAGMLAGAMTSTPVLVGAGDTLRHFGLPSDQLAQSLDHLSLGYALTYLVGLVSLIVGAAICPSCSIRICRPAPSKSPASAASIPIPNVKSTCR